ncbi:hypothetical protein N9043_02020 [bacterium]|nr:hypothetical protein [bacterium]
MVGAKDFCKSDEDRYVAFKFKMSCFNYCEITLTGDDLYTMTLQKWIWSRDKVTKEVVIEGLYFDQLKGEFEKNTKLYLSL